MTSQRGALTIVDLGVLASLRGVALLVVALLMGLSPLISLRLLIRGEPRHSPPKPVTESDDERSRPQA